MPLYINNLSKYVDELNKGCKSIQIFDFCESFNQPLNFVTFPNSLIDL